MCLKSTLSDLETKILCALSNNAKATDRLKFTGGFFMGFFQNLFAVLGV